MQSLEIISVNLWQILISLCNLLLLFLIIKRFLFAPVKKMFAARKAQLDEKYAAADAAQRDAQTAKEQWETQMKGAKAEVDTMLKEAGELAAKRSEKIVAEAKEQAETLVRQAKADIELEKQKSANEMKQEIVGVSVALAQKMIRREIATEDHRELIDSFIDEIGENK